MKRVLVCGGRDYVQVGNVFAALKGLWESNGRALVVIEGGGRGADTAAACWAEAWAPRGVEHVEFKANWREHGKNAGPRRNQKMLDEGKPDVVLAFPGGRGTADMVMRAEGAGIPVVRPCADGTMTHDFKGGTRCPSCGFAGIKVSAGQEGDA
jgi:hypothetical protein